MLTNTHPAFDGIDALYADNILPRLLPLETRRQAFWKQFKLFAIALFIVAATVGFFIFNHTENIAMLFICGAACMIGLGGFYGVKSRAVRGDTKFILMSELSSFVGLAYKGLPDIEADFLVRLQALNLLPSRVHRSSFEDGITGRIGDVDVKVCEAKLEQKIKTDKGEHWKTVFQGSLLEMDFHRDFLGTTIVLRDAGIFNAKRKGEMKRIGLASTRFEKLFEAYGTDQVEGRYLLTPTFMETLIDLEETVDGKKIRFAFNEGRLWIAVEHPNRFETKSLRQPMTDIGRVQTIIDELEAIFTIVTAVAAPKKRR